MRTVLKTLAIGSALSAMVLLTLMLCGVSDMDAAIPEALVFASLGFTMAIPDKK